MLAFQAEVVYVDGTWRFEVASSPSPHLVMTRAELFLSPDMSFLTMSGLILLEGTMHSCSSKAVPQRGAGWGRMGDGLQSGLRRPFEKKGE